MKHDQGRNDVVPAAEVDAEVEIVIELMRQMALITAEENGILSQGIPASLASTSIRKNELADRFEEWVDRVRRAQLRIGHADPATQARLLSGIKGLREVTDENVVRLRTAMEASRCRVEAVMNAVREQIASTSPYGANGRIQGSAASAGYGASSRSV